MGKKKRDWQEEPGAAPGHVGTGTERCKKRELLQISLPCVASRQPDGKEIGGKE